MSTTIPQLNQLNLTELLRKPLLDNHHDIGLSKLGLITPIAIDQFVNMDVKPVQWKSEGVTWMVIVVVAAGAVLFIVALYLMYRHEGKWLPKQCQNKRVIATLGEEGSLPEELNMLDTDCNGELSASENVLSPQEECKQADDRPDNGGLIALKRGRIIPTKQSNLGSQPQVCE